jgi:hypothetical protein
LDWPARYGVARDHLRVPIEQRIAAAVTQYFRLADWRTGGSIR